MKLFPKHELEKISKLKQQEKHKIKELLHKEQHGLQLVEKYIKLRKENLISEYAIKRMTYIQEIQDLENAIERLQKESNQLSKEIEEKKLLLDELNK